MREIEKRLGGMLVLANYMGINKLVFEEPISREDLEFCVQSLLKKLDRSNAPDWLVINALMAASWPLIEQRKLSQAKALLLEAKALGAETSGHFGRIQEKQGRVDLALRLYSKAVQSGQKSFQEEINRINSAKRANQPLIDKPAFRLIRNFKDAERAACDWLRNFGYHDAALTTPGRDGGVDVYGSDFVAQVKMEAKPTGAPVVQAIAGIAAAQGKKAFFFSSAGYTQAARDFALQGGVALFQFDLQGEPEPKNSFAFEIVRN